MYLESVLELAASSGENKYCNNYQTCQAGREGEGEGGSLPEDRNILFVHLMLLQKNGSATLQRQQKWNLLREQKRFQLLLDRDEGGDASHVAERQSRGGMMLEPLPKKAPSRLTEIHSFISVSQDTRAVSVCSRESRPHQAALPSPLLPHLPLPHHRSAAPCARHFAGFSS